MTGCSPRRQEPDLYRLLEVDRNASRADVVRAYHLKARFLHPDASHDRDAAARFRELTGAYEVLSDPARRNAYDQRHPGPEPVRPEPVRPEPVRPEPVRPEPPGRAARGRTAPATAHPAPAGGAPIWAGPVHVQPPGRAVAGRSARPDSREVRSGMHGIQATLLAEMIGRYLGAGPIRPGADEDWPL
ncbi:MAG: J domain-containing protein [Streptosporangiaceae bacterium]